MKAFKYLIFLFFFFPIFAHSANFYTTPITGSSTYSSPEAACRAALSYNREFKEAIPRSNGYQWDCYYKIGDTGRDQYTVATLEQIACPSATSVDLKVPTSSGSYVCTAGCQYKLKACVDVDFEAGMTCTEVVPLV